MEAECGMYVNAWKCVKILGGLGEIAKEMCRNT